MKILILVCEFTLLMGFYKKLRLKIKGKMMRDRCKKCAIIFLRKR